MQDAQGTYVILNKTKQCVFRDTLSASYARTDESIFLITKSITMTTMFFYGTLQMPSVQVDLLGREFKSLGVHTIDGYVAVRDYFVEDGYYPRLVEMDKGIVYGNVYQMSDDEIAILDAYETDAYELRKLTTTDGLEVYVYMGRSTDIDDVWDEECEQLESQIQAYEEAMLDDYEEYL